MPELAPADYRARLLAHPIYGAVRDLPALRVLMREHVFAVWDFMSLLKRLQREVTCVEVPWRPAADPASARFILEIVLGEEADEDGRGGYLSHYELYREAMAELAVDTRPIDTFLSALATGQSWERALDPVDILPSTREFVRYSMQLATHGTPEQVAAAFFYGREDIIPEMFARLVTAIQAQGTVVDRFRHYLRRHIEVDGDQHGPLAARLLDRLCQNDASKRAAAEAAACEALKRRIGLWDGVLAAIGRA
jgi:hypothetical protein